MAIAPIEYVKRTILNLGYLKLKLVIRLGRSDRFKNRSSDISIYEYSSNKYNNKTLLSSINIKTSAFLVLEIPDDVIKSEVYFSFPHMYFLKKFFNEIEKWFFDKKYKDLYYYNKNNELVVNKDFKKYKKIRITDLPSNVNIIAYPSIINNNDIYEEGVTFHIEPYNTDFTLDINDFCIIYDIIKNFDLFTSSQLLINFALTLNNNIDNIVIMDENSSMDYLNNRQTRTYKKIKKEESNKIEYKKKKKKTKKE